jgi:hypothetical protein
MDRESSNISLEFPGQIHPGYALRQAERVSGNGVGHPERPSKKNRITARGRMVIAATAEKKTGYQGSTLEPK